MMDIGIDDYEKLVDKIISGNFTPSEVTSFVQNTPILPILTKIGIPTKKSIVSVIVTSENGVPIPSAKVIVAGKTAYTDPTGKAEFTFDDGVPAGVVLITKGEAISRVPFTGISPGNKAVIAAILSNNAESPVMFGDSLKNMINSYYQWKLIQNVEQGVFQPHLSQFPQVGLLKRKSDYEYSVYVPVPVNIKIPAINFTPQISVPGMPNPVSIPSPTGYTVTLSLNRGNSAPQSISAQVSLVGISVPYSKIASGGYGKYTFSNVPPGTYNIVISSPLGVIKRQITVSNSGVNATVNLNGRISPFPPLPESGEVIIKVIPVSNSSVTGQPTRKHLLSVVGGGLAGVNNPANANVTVFLDSAFKNGSYGTYTFPIVSPGQHMLKVIVNGKVVKLEMFDLSPGETKNIVVQVPVQAPPSPPIISPTPVQPPSQAPVTTPPPVTTPVPSPVPSPVVKGKIIVDVVELKPPSRGGILSLSNTNIIVKIDGVSKYGGIGKYMFSNLKPGEHSVVVYANNKEIYSGVVSIEAGKTKSITITYHPAPRTGTLVVNVAQQSTGSGGSPVSAPSSGVGKIPPISSPINPGNIARRRINPRISLFGPLSVSGGSMALSYNVVVSVDGVRKSGSYGAYTFNNINPGTHHVEVYSDGRLIKSETVSVSPGGTKKIYVTILAAPQPRPGSPTPMPPVGHLPVIR